MAPVVWIIPLILLAFVLLVRPLRHAFAEGWLCLGRYPALWKIPAFFAAWYAAFDLAAYLLIPLRLQQDIEIEPTVQALTSSDWLVLGARSLLPGTEQMASVLNCLISPFPLSSFFAMLFLTNGWGLGGEVRRTLRRRFPRVGKLLFVSFIFCALAALAKPAFLLALPELSLRFPWQQVLLGTTLLNALSFVFEYLVGTVCQLYLLFMAYGWMRGLQFPQEKLLSFAVRRLGFVLKWALVIIAATLLLVHAPLAWEAMATGDMTWRTDLYVRPLLIIFMMTFGAVQIRLALHNESLGKAFAANRRFLVKHAPVYVSFLFISAVILVGLQTLTLAGEAYLGSALPGQLAVAAGQIFAAGIGGWLLATWVCLYKDYEKA